MRLNHNLASLNVYQNYSKALVKQSASLAKISSGYKVNSAKDNPNVIAQSERMRLQIRGTQMAQKNVQDGVSMLQTAEGGLEEIGGMLTRIRELTVQAGGSTTESDKATIQNEIGQMLSGIKNMAQYNEFNGVKCIGNDKVTDNTKPPVVKMQVGANVDESIDIPQFNLVPEKLLNKDGTQKLSDIKVSTSEEINKSLQTIDNAIVTVLSVRSQYGALENRFSSSMDSMIEIGDRVQGAESAIRDVDIAEEMMNYSRANILVEVGNAMMVQTNKLPQDVLQTLGRMK